MVSKENNVGEVSATGRTQGAPSSIDEGISNRVRSLLWLWRVVVEMMYASLVRQ